MNFVQFALRRPYTVLVLVLGVIIGAVLGIRSMARDIFPPVRQRLPHGWPELASRPRRTAAWREPPPELANEILTI